MDALKLSEAERLILLNQYLILKKLDPEDSKDYDLKIEILQAGLVGAYRFVLTDLEPETPPEVFEKALEILDMYRRLIDSNATLESNGFPKERLRFPGFDGNNESSLSYSANVFVEKMGRYEEIGKIPNTHMPVVFRYDKMLAKLSEYGDKMHQLTKDEIDAVLKAGDW